MIEKIKQKFQELNFEELNRDNYQKILIQLLSKDFTIEKIVAGGQKIALILEELNYVIKIPFYNDRHSARACKKELKIYEIAQWQEVDKFYLPLKEINIKGQYSIYLQEKAIPFNNSNGKLDFFNIEKIEYAERFFQENIFNFFNPQTLKTRNFLGWISYAISYYNKEEVIKFLNFFTWPLFSQDVFGDNMAITQSGKPVLIDYCY